MTENDATQQVLNARQKFDRTKTRVTEARTRVQTAEDQLAAADDAITNLDLDPDRDLARQVGRLVVGITTDLEGVEKSCNEVDAILRGDQ